MRRRAVPVIDAALQVLSRRFGTAATVAAALGTIAATAVLMCAMWFACRVLGAADPDFRGQPFNWVTMPDQFTRGALDRVLRAEASRPRLLAPVALLLSHAAWVPVPRLLDWGDLGDGSVFNGMAAAGDPPEVVWRNPERIRRQYRDLIGYRLQDVIDYARRNADDPPLLIALGDHQTAAGISLDQRRDTPLHVIGPARLSIAAQAGA